MFRSILTAIALVAVLAVPMTAAAHSTSTPKAVAWQVKDLANKNWKFANLGVRLVSATCQSRGDGGRLFVCRGRFVTDGGVVGTIYWSKVTMTDGYLRISKGTITS